MAGRNPRRRQGRRRSRPGIPRRQPRPPPGRRAPLGAILDFAAPGSFPVQAGEELALRVRAAGRRAGTAFLAVRFEPTGGEARLELPEGTFESRLFTQSFLVPPGATQARVIGAVLGATDALWLNALSVGYPLLPRTGLRAPLGVPARDTLFPPTPAPARELLALDVSKLPPDAILFAVTLQGLVNRSQPRLYLFHKPDDRFWADWLVEAGYVGAIKELSGLPALVAAFRAEIPAVVVYDPALPASRHAAALLGALQGCPATGRETANTLGLPVASDLTGRWKRNVDAYRELWAKYRDRFDGASLAVHNPLRSRPGGLDFLVQKRVFTFWVSGPRDQDPGGDPAAELDFAHEVLAALPPNTPVLGWQENDVHGLFPDEALRLASSYAKFIVGGDFCTNLSVLSGLRVPPDVFRQSAHSVGLVWSGSAQPDVEEPRLLYATLSALSGGESPGMWQHEMAALWRDPARGRVPVNWSVPPAAAELMPPVLAWFYRQATPHDLLLCAHSGLGAIDPRFYALRYRAADRDAIWNAYLGRLDGALRALDLDILSLHAGGAAADARFFRGAPALRGILAGLDRQEGATALNPVEAVDGKPVFHTLTRERTRLDLLAGEKAAAEYALREFLGSAPKERPAYMSALLPLGALRPALAAKLAASLPPDVRLVDADALVDLWTKRLKP
ncbi:MAG: GxGYxYP family putative glycoside hydrolase [Verrucomicrobium sp.]|nr:GxGYxYP family putative glycoside hydrolase [Verrucomicrobium sp.]